MRVTTYTGTVLNAVHAERRRQYEKFGDQNILRDGSDPVKLAALAEEFGEVATEVTEGELNDGQREHPGMKPYEHWERMRKELIQVAAVAVAWVEANDQVYGVTP